MTSKDLLNDEEKLLLVELLNEKVADMSQAYYKTILDIQKKAQIVSTKRKIG